MTSPYRTRDLTLAEMADILVRALAREGQTEPKPADEKRPAKVLAKKGAK